MGKIARFLDEWSGRIANGLTVWPFVPVGAFAVLMGYLSTSVAWVSQFGAFGWLSIVLVAFVLGGLGLALIGGWRVNSAQAKMLARLSSDSSHFDPMASTFENKVLFLKDLVPPGRRHMENRKFINCEIIGPGNIVVCLNSAEGVPSVFRGNIYYDVDCIQVDPAVNSNNAIYFPGCDFEKCKFYNLNLLFYDRYSQDWHWITPISDQQVLISAPLPVRENPDEIK